MATPRLLLSKLLRRSPSLLLLSSPSSSSSSIFLSQSRNLTTANSILGIPPAPVRFLAPQYNFWCSRFLSTHGSDDGEDSPPDSEFLPEEFFNAGFEASYDGSGLEVAEAMVTASAGDGGETLLPVRALISLLDCYHEFTGLPWWVIIASSTLALRITLLPVLMLQLEKLKKIGELFPKLPPPFPPPLSGKSYIDQFSLFRKERQAAKCPSFLWCIAYSLVQVPCFLLWMTSIRKMSLDHHPGFDCGGILWFQNLTELPHGLVGPIFPILIATLYFINIQISFQKSSVGKMTGLFGSLVQYYKYYLQFLTIPIFFIGFCIPQGSLVYWLTNNSLTLILQLSFRHPAVRQKLGLPDKEAVDRTGNSEKMDRAEKTHPNLLREQRQVPVQHLAPQELLAFSVKLLANGRKDRAIPLLRLALDKDPEYVRALVVLGQTFLQNGQLAEAIEYLERAISKLFLTDHPMKLEEVDLLILASQWAGVAYIRQDKNTEGIWHLERIANLKEPEDSKCRAHYYDAFILLASALYRAGRKAEAAKYLRRAVAYDSAYSVYLEQCEKDEDDFANDLASTRRGDY